MKIGYWNKTLGISVQIRAPENVIEGKHVQSVMLSHFDVDIKTSVNDYSLPLHSQSNSVKYDI
jgi:hypothetical protein